MNRIQPVVAMLRASRPLCLQYSYLSSAVASQVKQSEPKPFSDIPEVKGLPIVGNIPRIMKALHEGKAGDEWIWNKLHMEYGPIYRVKMLGNSWDVMVASAEACETILRSEGKFPSRGDFEENMIWLFNKLKTPVPMFFDSGESWKKTRSNAAQQIAPRRVGNFVKPLSEIADELLAHFETLLDESGNVADIRLDIAKWAFQGVSYFVYNEKIDIYSEKNPDQMEFMEAALDYINSLAIISTTLPTYRLYRSKSYRDFEKILRRVQKAGKSIVDRRYKEIKDSIASGTIGDETKLLGLLDQWLIEGKFTEEEALSQSFDMLSAGIDTTSSSTNLLIYEIAKQPALQERLVQEIRLAIGDKTHPTWEDLQKMPLLRNCVKELTRLYQPVGGIPRRTTQDVELEGYKVPAETNVTAILSMVTRDPQVYEDPDEFKPDRWDKEASEKIHPFSSLPFGFGPRSCYGRRLAELEMYILMAKMLPKYHITTNMKELKLEHKLILKADEPLQINFQQRSSI